MSRRLLILANLLLILLAPTLDAQDVTEQVILLRDSTSHSPIEGAVVTLYREEAPIGASFMSDERGEVSVRWSRDASHLVIRKMGYRKYRLPKSRSGSSPLTIELPPSESILPEVTVTRHPIKQIGDTLVYDATAYLHPSDETLRDILRRLPGIEVTDAGSIKYQGEPIKKFYIEDMDLLGSMYHRASQNLSAESVSRIEVLERHQDIKALRGRVFEPKASLNIRLKEHYKARPFGYLSGSADERLRHFAGHLSLTQVGGKRLQYITDLKGNTLGTLYESEGQPIVEIGSAIDLLPPLPTLIPSITGKETPLPTESFIRNRSGLIGGNALLKTSTDATLRMGITALYDTRGLSSHTIDQYSDRGDTEINEMTEHTGRLTALSPSLTYEINRSSLYLSDRMTLDFGSSHLLGAINRSESHGEIEGTTGHRTITNKLHGVIPIRSIILSLHSVVRYDRRRSELTTSHTPGAVPDPELRREEWLTRNLIGSRVALTDHLDLDVSLRHDLTKRILSKDLPMAIRSALLSQSLQLTPNLNYHPLDLIGLTLSVPIEYKRSDLYYTNGPIRSNHLVPFTPSLSLRYTPDQDHRISISVRHTRDLTSEIDYFPTPLRYSHRLFRLSPEAPAVRSSWRASLSESYKDLLNYIFAHTLISLAISNEPYVECLAVTPQKSEISYSLHPHTSRRLQARSKIEKSFIDRGVDLRLSCHYSYGDFLSEINNIPREGDTQLLGGTLGLDYEPGERLRASSEISWTGARVSPKGQDPLQTGTLRSLLSLSYSPTDCLTISSRYEGLFFAHSKEERSHSTIHLLNISAKYRVNKDLRVSLDCLNLLNQQSYSIHNVRPYGERLTKTPLTPFRILVSATYHFR